MNALPAGAGDDRDALLERAWRWLSRWAVPVMMCAAYALLAVTSEVDPAGTAWMAVGLVFVMVVWFVFRRLTATAGLSRALSVGDTAKLLELSDRDLARKRPPADRARYLVARGLARFLRGELADALAALDGIALPPELEPVAEVVRIGARLDLGRAADAGVPVVPVVSVVYPRDALANRRSPALGWLAAAQRAWGRHELDAAAPLLARVIDDVRGGAATRAIAHVYAARIAEARGELAVAARHRAQAASLASPDAAWLRGPGTAAA